MTGARWLVKDCNYFMAFIFVKKTLFLSPSPALPLSFWPSYKTALCMSMYRTLWMTKCYFDHKIYQFLGSGNLWSFKDNKNVGVGSPNIPHIYNRGFRHGRCVVLLKHRKNNNECHLKTPMNTTQVMMEGTCSWVAFLCYKSYYVLQLSILKQAFCNNELCVPWPQRFSFDMKRRERKKRQ